LKLFLTFFVLCFINSGIAQDNLTERQKNYNRRAASAEWQPDKVIETLNIQKGWFIGDLGAGGGYYTLRLAEMTGISGKVFAADINKDFLKGIKKEAESSGLLNVDTVLAHEDDSGFKDNSLDLIFIRNTFHHLTKRDQYMKQLAKKLKQSGKIVIIDYKKSTSSYHGHDVTHEEILSAIENSSLIVDKEFNFIEKQFFLVLKLKE
jgi:arsenite methyltransferase